MAISIKQYAEREEARETFKQEALASLDRIQGNRTAFNRSGGAHLVEYLGYRCGNGTA